MAWKPRRTNLKYDVLAFRRRIGLTQHELAALIGLGCTDRNVRRWEREGITPRKRFLDRIRQIEQHRFPADATPAPRVEAQLPPAPPVGLLPLTF